MPSPFDWEQINAYQKSVHEAYEAFSKLAKAAQSDPSRLEEADEAEANYRKMHRAWWTLVQEKIQSERG